MSKSLIPQNTGSTITGAPPAPRYIPQSNAGAVSSKGAAGNSKTSQLAGDFQTFSLKTLLGGKFKRKLEEFLTEKYTETGSQIQNRGEFREEVLSHLLHGLDDRLSHIQGVPVNAGKIQQKIEENLDAALDALSNTHPEMLPPASPGLVESLSNIASRMRQTMDWLSSYVLAPVSGIAGTPAAPKKKSHFSPHEAHAASVKQHVHSQLHLMGVTLDFHTCNATEIEAIYGTEALAIWSRYSAEDKRTITCVDRGVDSSGDRAIEVYIPFEYIPVSGTPYVAYEHQRLSITPAGRVNVLQTRDILPVTNRTYPAGFHQPAVPYGGFENNAFYGAHLYPAQLENETVVDPVALTANIIESPSELSFNGGALRIAVTGEITPSLQVADGIPATRKTYFIQSGSAAGRTLEILRPINESALYQRDVYSEDPNIPGALFQISSVQIGELQEVTPAPTPEQLPPSIAPSPAPTPELTARPSVPPSTAPTPVPSVTLTERPSVQPSPSPTGAPSPAPSRILTVAPTPVPSVDPTAQPSEDPTAQPSADPTAQPSPAPSFEVIIEEPSPAPSNAPSDAPSEQPSPAPSAKVTFSPSESPSGAPTNEPSTHNMTVTTEAPSTAPTSGPTPLPTYQVALDTANPTAGPTERPSPAPTFKMTVEPTPNPSANPTAAPTYRVTLSPTDNPTATPTVIDITTPPSPSPTPSSTNGARENGTSGATNLASLVGGIAAGVIVALAAVAVGCYYRGRNAAINQAMPVAVPGGEGDGRVPLRIPNPQGRSASINHAMPVAVPDGEGDGGVPLRIPNPQGRSASGDSITPKRFRPRSNSKADNISAARDARNARLDEIEMV